MPETVSATKIREYIRSRYLEPARRRREMLVTLRAGDIHRELGLHNRVPNVCQVMESRLLEREASVKVSSKQGPPSGRGTNLTITYAIDLLAPAVNQVKAESKGSSLSKDHPGVDLFLALRGQGADIYAEDGGGEAWLIKERAEFYGQGKQEPK